MSAATIPPCCTPPAALWPFDRRLPAVHLHGCRFDPTLLPAEAFQQAGIAAPHSILRAVAKRQTEFLAGRLCARAALQAQGEHTAAVSQDAQGTPLWPDGFCGSITHSHGLAAAVAAPRQQFLGIGLDAEPVMSASRAQRLARQILCPAELQRLACLPEAERARLVSLTFCSKESLFKALYPLVGQRFYFQDAELLAWQANGQLQLRLLRDLGEQWPQGSLLHGLHATVGSHLLSLISISAASNPD